MARDHKNSVQDETNAVTIRLPRGVLYAGLVLAGVLVALFALPMLETGYRSLVSPLPTPVGKDVTYLALDQNTNVAIFEGPPGRWQSPTLALPAGTAQISLVSEGQTNVTIRPASRSTGVVQPFNVQDGGGEDGRLTHRFHVLASGEFVIELDSRLSFWHLQVNVLGQ